MKIIPYLNFNGRSAEALEFYRQALGAEITLLMHFKDHPEPDCIPPGAENKIMHATVNIGDAEIMVSDGQCQGEAGFQGVSLSIGLDDIDEARRYFDALCEGGDVTMPLEKTFWSPGFGMVTDKFGVSWMVNVTA